MRAGRLLLNVGLATGLLLAAEGWCSLGDKQSKYRLSSTLGYELTPGYRGRRESVNLAGLRGAEIGPKVEGRLRILAMGGSTTWGHKVNDDETWPVALERQLRAATGREVEVLNGGVSGWDIEQIVTALRQRYLDEFQPDVVLVNAGWNIPLLAGNAPVEHVRQQIIAEDRRDGLYRSALVRSLANMVDEWREDDAPPRLDGAQATSEARARCYPPYYAELRRLCDAHGARVYALAYPCLVQRPPPSDAAALAAYERPLRETLGASGSVAELVEIAATQYDGGLKAVRDASAQAGIEVLDLAGRLLAGLPAQGADAAWAGYFRDHAHFTPAGDAAVGAALAGLLVDAHVVDARP